MRLDIKKCIIFVFILIVTFLTASEEKIPNVVIWDNPTKVVSTVDGLKNRKAAEMNIKVKKRNIEEIVGVKSANGIDFILPDGILADEEIIVIKSLANLPTNSSKRRKNDAVAVTVSEVIKAGDKKIVRIPTKEVEHTNYILKINKKNNEISKIYKGNIVSRRTLSKDYSIVLRDLIILDKRAIGEFPIYNGPQKLTDDKSQWLAGYKSVSINQISSYDEYKVNTNSGLNFPCHGMLVGYHEFGNANIRYFQNIKDEYGRSIPNYHYEGWIGIDGEQSKFARSQNCYTDFYSSLQNPINYWIVGVSGQFPNNNNAQIGKYKLQHNMEFTWNSYTGNLTHATIYSNVFVTDSLVENVDYIINSAEINKKTPIAVNGTQEISFYNSNKDNIKISKDGRIVSTNGKASFNINGNEFDLLFEQVVGEYAKPYIIMKKLGTEFTLPLKVEVEIDNHLLKTYNVTLKLIKKDIGEVKFQVDNRLKDNTKNGYWVRTNGAQSDGINATPHDTYPELVNLSGNFTGLEWTNISDVVSIEGRPIKSKNAFHKVFMIAARDYNDESAMPFGINLNTLKNNLVISMYNSNNENLLNNRFILQGVNGTFYDGNIKESYLGKSALEGVATLDMTELSLDDWSRWDTPEVTGDATSTAGTPGTSTVMKFSSGKLFNFKSAVKNSTGHIVTKLKVTASNGESDEVLGAVNSKIQTTSKITNNKIGMEASGGIFITKKTESATPVTYNIEAYYEDILLGKLTVTIKNRNLTKIGEVEFQIDNRLKDNTKNGYWVRTNGAQSDGINATPHDTYPELVNLSGNFTGLEWTNISDVVSIEGRPIKSKNAFHKVFMIAARDYNDESAMPFNIFLKTLKNNLVISMYNSNNPNMLNNRFVLKGANGTFYGGNVKEVYSGNKAIGNGKIDLATAAENKIYTFEKSSTGVASAIEDANVKLNITGQLPQTQGFRKENIVDNFKISINGGAEESIVGQSYTANSKYDICFEPTTGNLQIKKKQKNVTYVDNINIKYFYKDIELGEVTLEIENKGSSFVIVGDDVIDFGAIVQGQESKIDGTIVIKNLESRKILNVTLNDQKPIKLLKKNDSSVELPVVGDVSLLKRDIEVPIRVDLSAKPKVNQPVGDYEGEINLYIYID